MMIVHEEEERLTSVLAAKAFSPHKTHSCLLGSGICLSDFVSRYNAPRADVAWYWMAAVCLFGDCEVWLSEALKALE